jgi:hypothetical protein
MVSSMYPVRSQPVGPMMPSGILKSNGDLLIATRHAWNLTSTFRLSSRFRLKATVTVNRVVMGQKIHWLTLFHLEGFIEMEIAYR